ncbi:MAG: AraC family transcriptional regulator [Gammaproteobacteria bacterium]|nr:MAG: AraC family transcriptional regulator [Gammaproteobacteria bacterium]
MNSENTHKKGLLLAGTSHRSKDKQHLVENKLSFSGPESELSIYDTYQSASGVRLDTAQLLYCGMVQGKKIMHDREHPDEDETVFLPHESFVLPPGTYVDIDFPDASEDEPTICLTIEISKQRIETIAEKMRDLTMLDEIKHDWEYKPHILHSEHTQDTQQLLDKLVTLFTHNHPDKEMMMDLGVSELIIRLLRQQGRDVLLSYCREFPDASSITSAIVFLEQNLLLPFDIEQLCKVACMSRSRLYTEFKKQLGCTPSEFQQQLRLKSAVVLLKKGHTVTSACYDSGFTDLSHFSRRFTRFYNCSPSQFRANHNEQSTS